MRRSLLRWAAFVPPLLFFPQVFFSSLEKSLTWDEPTFIVSGYTYLTRDDFRFNPEAPPLMQQLVALPLLAMDLEVPPTSHPDWQTPNQVGYAKEFMRLNADRIRTIAIWARLPAMLLDRPVARWRLAATDGQGGQGAWTAWIRTAPPPR